MDYEKAYKAAKRVAAHWIENGCEATERVLLETIFPELKESEDDRILRTIIKGFENWKRSGMESFNNTKVDDILAYLKKQKPAERIEDSVKFKEGFNAGRESGLRDGQKYVLDNLDSYGLCKPAEWNAEDYEMLHLIIDYFESTKIPMKINTHDKVVDFKEIAEWLKSLRPQSHWKPNEKQKYDGNMDKECIKLCDTLNSIRSINTFESCCGHLKDRYSIWFFCNDIITISRLGRSVERNYSDGKWELLVDSTDTHPTGVFWLRSKVPFQSYDEMEKSVNEMCDNIQHWFNAEFDSYFKNDCVAVK